MLLYRHHYFQNGQGCVGFYRIGVRKKRVLKSKLAWQCRDIYGKQISSPAGLTVCSPNNWLRRILYFFGAKRWMIRSV